MDRRRRRRRTSTVERGSSYSRSINNPAVPLSDKAILKYLGGPQSDAGVAVTPFTALTCAALWQGINLICSDLGKLPIHLYKRLPNGDREEDREHPSSFTVRRKPNSEMMISVLIQTLTHHALLWGNGYGLVFRDGPNPEVIPLNPSCTVPERRNGTLFYKTRVGGEDRFHSSADVIHIRGLAEDGLQGYSIVRLARQNLGLYLAAEKYGAKFFGNSTRASGFLRHPKNISPDAEENLRKSINTTGIDNAFRLMLLEEGIEFQQMTIPNEEAQFLQSREFGKRDAAAWLNMPVHKLAETSRSSHASLIQEQQAYLDSTLSRWLQQWEEQLWDKLLTEAEKLLDTHYFEFKREALLQMDPVQQSSVFNTGRLGGWYNVNEIRRALNLPGIGPKGDIYIEPGNMRPVGDKAPAPSPDPSPASDDPAASDPPANPGSQTDAREALGPVLSDALTRVVRLEANEAKRATKKPNFVAWLDGFAVEQQERVSGIISPYLRAVASVWPAVEVRGDAVAALALAARLDPLLWSKAHAARLHEQLLNSSTPAAERGG